MTTTFCRKLKSQRKKNNFTQTDLAKLLNVSRTCISNWESGLRVPDFVMISKLSAVFGVSAEYFINEACKIHKTDLGIDISKLNDNGREALRKYYRFLLSDEKMINQQ